MLSKNKCIKYRSVADPDLMGLDLTRIKQNYFYHDTLIKLHPTTEHPFHVEKTKCLNPRV